MGHGQVSVGVSVSYLHVDLLKGELHIILSDHYVSNIELQWRSKTFLVASMSEKLIGKSSCPQAKTSI